MSDDAMAMKPLDGENKTWEIRNVCIIGELGLPSIHKATIRISGSQIVEVDHANLANDYLDATGLVALSGVIDPHVHFRTPGWEHKEDWTTGSASALLGGVTTVFDMPNTPVPLTTAEGVKDKEDFVGDRAVDYRFWIGATADDNTHAIAEAARYTRHRLAGVKIYMGSSTGNLLVTDEKLLRKYFIAGGENDLVVGVHCEDEALIREQRQKAGKNPQVYQHCHIRNTEVEIVAVAKALRLQKEIGCTLYLCHISTPEAVELASRAKDEGRSVYVEVCPHHVLLPNTKMRDPKSAQYYKMNPSLRRLEQVLRLRAYLPRQGFVDTIGSDHAPHTREEKSRAAYDEIPSGVPGVQTLLLSLLRIGWTDGLALERVVELTSRNAARIFGLKRKGRIGPGYDADIVLVSPDTVTTIRDEDMATKCGWTPFRGMFVRGTPEAVVAAGALRIIGCSFTNEIIPANM